ncbi:MAG: GIY-YIG nuclease family protein [Verrucomicrobia bacterium]|nr:GIY-YIG nuclease family protein [Verrucomicrobiota bacterium]
MAQRTHLVCQHLENISREALEKHQDIIRNFVRRRQGVYALYRRGRLYYVGLASNLRSRLSHHLKDRHGHSWNRFCV